MSVRKCALLGKLVPYDLERLDVDHAVVDRVHGDHGRTIQVEHDLVVRIGRHAYLVHLHLDPLERRGRPDGDVIAVFVGARQKLVQMWPHELDAALSVRHMIEQCVVDVEHEQLLVRSHLVEHLDRIVAHSFGYFGQVLLAMLELHIADVHVGVYVQVVDDLDGLLGLFVHVVDLGLHAAHHHHLVHLAIVVELVYERLVAGALAALGLEAEQLLALGQHAGQRMQLAFHVAHSLTAQQVAHDVVGAVPLDRHIDEHVLHLDDL